MTPSVDQAPAAEAPGPPADARTTVIETPDAVPDSDGRVTAGNDDERFEISHEAEVGTHVDDPTTAGGALFLECNNAVGAIVCGGDESSV